MSPTFIRNVVLCLVASCVVSATAAEPTGNDDSKFFEAKIRPAILGVSEADFSSLADDKRPDLGHVRPGPLHSGETRSRGPEAVCRCGTGNLAAASAF